MKEKEAEFIFDANSMMVQIVGMTSISLLLVTTLEVDVAYVTMCLGNFY